MSLYSNATLSPLRLPEGDIIAPRGSADLDAKTLKHPVVKAWLDGKTLVKGKIELGAGGQLVTPGSSGITPAEMQKAVDAATVAGEQKMVVAREAWESFKTLPENASDEQADAAQKALDAALGVVAE